MRKFFRLALFFVLLSLTGGPLAFADEREEPDRTKKRPADKGKIHAAGETHLRDRLRSLEQDIGWMKQEIRYLKDRNKTLEHRINDLRSRHT